MKGYQVNAAAGHVVGLRGKPIRRRNGRGYVEVHSGGRLVGLAHRMIWEAVNGPIPPGYEINHVNGVKDDNRIENLELVTPSENSRHAFATGLRSAVGEKNGRALLSAGQVRAIRELLAAGRTRTAIARLYGVSRSAVSDIATRRNWSHVE